MGGFWPWPRHWQGVVATGGQARVQDAAEMSVCWIVEFCREQIEGESCEPRRVRVAGDDDAGV